MFGHNKISRKSIRTDLEFILQLERRIKKEVPPECVENKQVKTYKLRHLFHTGNSSKLFQLMKQKKKE